MTRRYEVVPNDVTDIRPNDGVGVRDGQEWIRLVGTGRAGEGDRITPLSERDFSGLDLYYSVEDNTIGGAYQVWDGLTDLTFNGTVHAPTARVIEDRSAHITDMPINDVFAAKELELEQYVDEVFFSSYQMVGAGATLFWVNASLRSRLYRTDVDAFYQWTPPENTPTDLVTQTGADPIISDSGQVWRDVPVWIVRVDNGNKIRTKVDADEYKPLKRSQGKFSIDVAYAADDTWANLEALLNANDRDGLAAYDVRSDPNATNPWPPHDANAFNGAAF